MTHILEPITGYTPDGHRVDTGIDAATGELVTKIVPCRRISCHHKECRAAIAREDADATAWIARQHGHTDLLTVNHLEITTDPRAIKAAILTGLQKGFKKSEVRVKIVIEPHKSGQNHAHCWILTPRRLHHADRAAVDAELRATIPAASEIHHSQRAAEDSDPSYTVKELLSHPAQHRARNRRGAYDTASRGFYKHTTTPEARARQQAARLERSRRAAYRQIEADYGEATARAVLKRHSRASGPEVLEAHQHQQAAAETLTRATQARQQASHGPEAPDPVLDELLTALYGTTDPTEAEIQACWTELLPPPPRT